jgi:hypothetical protein
VISKYLVALLRVLQRFFRVQLDPVIRNGNGRIFGISVDILLWKALRSRLHCGPALKFSISACPVETRGPQLYVKSHVSRAERLGH